MKKLLELLGIILITSNAAGPLIANKPNNNKDKIKNSLETLTYQKRQAPKGGKGKNKKDNLAKSTTDTTTTGTIDSSISKTDNQVEFIEKEINLDENYSENIQTMLKDFMKNNQIDPLRIINNEGIVTTDYYETHKRKKERDANLKIIEKVEQILKLDKFDANTIRILILTLKNKDNKIRLVINLQNFYFQGFINNSNQYFHFKDAELKSIKISNKQIDGIPLSYNWVYLKDLDVKEGQLDRTEKEKREKIKSNLNNNISKINKNNEDIQKNEDTIKKYKIIKKEYNV